MLGREESRGRGSEDAEHGARHALPAQALLPRQVNQRQRYTAIRCYFGSDSQLNCMSVLISVCSYN